LQSACAKAPSETRGLFGLLAALAGADRHGLPETTLATSALEEGARDETQAPEEPAGNSAGALQQEPATPERKQKETQTELAASNETATQTEPATQTEDAQTDDEKKLQEELATNNAHADSKSAKKRKKKKAAKELDAQTSLATASACTQTSEDAAPQEKKKKRVKFKDVSVTYCSDADEDAEYYELKSPLMFSDYDSADEDPMALRMRYGGDWRRVMTDGILRRGIPLDIYLDVWGNPPTHAYVTAHRKERWLNRFERLGTVVPRHTARLLV
jgi:hypothetical protein